MGQTARAFASFRFRGRIETNGKIDMILTEKEAATRRCTPFAVAYLMTPLVDRNVASAAGLPVSMNCIGSRCMQWRGHYEGDLGYCGLAGKPSE